MQRRLAFVGVAVLAWMFAPAPAYGEQKPIVITWADCIDTTTLTDSIQRLRVDADDSASIKATHSNFLNSISTKQTRSGFAAVSIRVF